MRYSLVANRDVSDDIQNENVDSTDLRTDSLTNRLLATKKGNFFFENFLLILKMLYNQKVKTFDKFEILSLHK